MPFIDPFDFSPLGIFNRLHAYMMATWMRVQYEWDTGNAFLDNQIAALIGAEDFQVIPHLREGAFIYPRMDVATIADNRRVVMVRGTSVLYDEVFAEITFSGQVNLAPWLGRVTFYFATVAARSFDRLPNLPNGWLAAGHSLGGAIVSLMGVHGAEKYFTCGQPREGDGTYANSRPSPLKLRIANSGDPIPLTPFSTAGPLDFLDLGPFSLGIFNRHWGQKRVLWPDGSTTYPPQEDRNPLIESSQLTVAFLRNGFNIHLAPEYCRRLRLGFPLEFPMTKPDADWPGLFELDQINADLNIGDLLQWDIPGTPSQGIPVTRRQPVPPGQSPNTDPYQFLCE